MQAIASAVQDTGPAADYSRFYAAVARAQLTNWLAELAPRRGAEREVEEVEEESSPPPRGARGAQEVRGSAQPPCARGDPGGRQHPPAQRRRRQPGGPVEPGGDKDEEGKPAQRRRRQPGGPGGRPPGLTPFLVDISGPGARAAEVAARAGHTVLRVVEPGTPTPPLAGYKGTGQVRAVAADGFGLEFLAGGCADGVIAENRTLSRQLAAETLVGEIARVLRPGGRVLACVDSLNLGMAVLAEQHRWPHLVDVPNADVVLVPWPDGTITRCYGAEQLRELFTGSGMEVSWIRPRTVFSPQTVSYLLARDPGSFGRLVTAELSARSDDSVGAQLIICARRC